jgi:hypothetical protein
MADCLASFTGPPVPARIKCAACEAWVPFEPPDIGGSVTVTCTGCGRELTIVGSPERRASVAER